MCVCPSVCLLSGLHPRVALPPLGSDPFLKKEARIEGSGCRNVEALLSQINKNKINVIQFN